MTAALYLYASRYAAVSDPARWLWLARSKHTTDASHVASHPCVPTHRTAPPPGLGFDLVVAIENRGELRGCLCYETMVDA